MQSQMVAYHGKETLKEKTVLAMKADIKAERLVKGHYWNTKSKNGCFVGCVIRGNEHLKFETVLGIPRILARLADGLFEWLSYDEAKKFSVDFLTSIPPGADLSTVWPKFAHFMLLDKEYGVINFAKKENVKKAIQAVGDLYKRVIGGEIIDTNLWLEAKSNAYAAASDAAYASAAAASDAAYASAAAYAAAAYDSARSRHCMAFAKVLVKFLKEAK